MHLFLWQRVALTGAGRHRRVMSGSKFSHLLISEGACAHLGWMKGLHVPLVPSCWLFCPSRRVRGRKCIQSDGSPQPLWFIPSIHRLLLTALLWGSQSLRSLFQSSRSHQPAKSRCGPRLQRCLLKTLSLNCHLPTIVLPASLTLCTL